jgi:hypothetical protein
VAEPRRWRQRWQQRRGWSSAGGVAAADGDFSSAVDRQELVLAVDDRPHGELQFGGGGERGLCIFEIE